MTRPFLIAQTPRAGRHHHVNLVPVGDLPGGVCVGDLLSAALMTTWAPNYVAVVRPVPQSPGGREGKEILLLGGIRHPTDPNERAGVVRWLQDRLVQLSEAVEHVDWDRHPGGDRPLELLDHWADEAGEAFGRRNSFAWLWVLLMAASFAVLVATVVVRFSQ